MEKVLHQILEIEQEARGIQQAADQLQAQLDDLKEKEDTFKAQSMEKARERLAKKQAALQEQQEQYYLQLRAQTDGELDRLQREWEQHHRDWVAALYTQVTAE